ncbi:MAG: HlyD family efflux transporter periplasmic adaptor subunit [Polyangiaceae bacterium]|nr:HlyD family efflux transporter periplasmic adaptor subunit [Polyangiaceae bacterium]
MLGDSRQAAAGAVDEAKALEKVASAQAKLAQTEAARAKAMTKEGVGSKAEQERAAAEAEAKAAGAESATFATRRRAWEHRTGQSDTASRIEGIRREIARVRGEIKTESATVARLENEIDERTVRASADGRIGDVPSKLRVGAVVEEGEHIASIVPEGGLLAVADFAPATAVGRIAAGQRARVRLHGFPWTTHGMVQAKVVRVGSEAREGRVRVELELDPPARPVIVLDHGLSGTVEVEVERVTPAELVLRTAGVLLAPRAAPAISPEPASTAP